MRWKAQEPFCSFHNSFLCFFSIPSNYLSVFPYPSSWRLVMLKFNYQILNSLHLVSKLGFPRPWQKHDQVLLLLRKPLLHLGLRLIIMLKKFKKCVQFKKCTHKFWMRWINNWQFWYRGMVVLIKEDCLHLQQMVKSDTPNSSSLALSQPVGLEFPKC